MKFRLLPLLLVVFTLLSFLFTLHVTHKKVGEPFPGYLTFENGVVGPFYLPSWSGPEKGIHYHALPQAAPEQEWTEVFSEKDYWFVVVLPAATGLLFFLLGALIYLYLPPGGGRIPLLLFHFLVGNYLIFSSEFQLTYVSSPFYLVLFALIPATMTHFAFLFPERTNFFERHWFSFLIPYLAGLLVAVPYVYYFLRDHEIWIAAEYAVVFYVVASYLFWIFRLSWILKRPHLEFNRIIAKYLLAGQIIGFVVPFAAAVAIFLGGFSLPLNLITPVDLLFPISLFIGVVLGRLKQGQMQLIQSEKRGALANLFAGLAHEINNPMTFVYSNLEPLRESLAELKEKHLPKNEETETMIKEIEKIVGNMEEGALRTKEIIENFRYFSHPDEEKVEEIDLHRLLDQSVLFLKPRWKERIVIHKDYGTVPKIKGSSVELVQVFLNLLANACDAIKEHGEIFVTTKSANGEIKVSVRDTGCGIARERLSRIFDPFYTTKGPGEGTGLGLSISMQILKKYHGEIEVKSEVGKGSEFIVRLPI